MADIDNILDLFDCNDSYIETKQETIVLILRKKRTIQNEFVFNIQNQTIFGTKSNIIRFR